MQKTLGNVKENKNLWNFKGFFNFLPRLYPGVATEATAHVANKHINGQGTQRGKKLSCSLRLLGLVLAQVRICGYATDRGRNDFKCKHDVTIEWNKSAGKVQSSGVGRNFFWGAITSEAAPRLRRRRRRRGGNGEGLSLPSRLRGLGERRIVSSPSGVRSRAPAENRFWCILSLKKNIWW